MKERTSPLPGAASGRKWRIRAPHIMPNPRRGATNAISIAVVKLERTPSDRRLAIRHAAHGRARRVELLDERAPLLARRAPPEPLRLDVPARLAAIHAARRLERFHLGHDEPYPPGLTSAPAAAVPLLGDGTTIESCLMLSIVAPRIARPMPRQSRETSRARVRFGRCTDTASARRPDERGPLSSCACARRLASGAAESRARRGRDPVRAPRRCRASVRPDRSCRPRGTRGWP